MLSDAHQDGFPSLDSDFDLRGVHVLPLENVVGLELRDETVEDSRVIEGLAGQGEAQNEIESASAGDVHRNSLRPEVICGGRRLEMDIVSHDARKFFRLQLKKNGYVLEQLYSPLIVDTTPEHAESAWAWRQRSNWSRSRLRSEAENFVRGIGSFVSVVCHEL